MFSRLKLRLGNHALAFAPDTLPDSDLDGTTLKRAAAGALFPNPSSLDCEHAQVLKKKIQLSYDPPAAVKPLKPKCWLLGSLTIEKK